MTLKKVGGKREGKVKQKKTEVKKDTNRWCNIKLIDEGEKRKIKPRNCVRVKSHGKSVSFMPFKMT